MREEDKRRFTRYTKESLCEVIIDSEMYKGKVVDYSDGVGVLIKKIPQLIQGALADIRITDCEIQFGAEVAWTEDFGYHLRVGFKRLGNLKGNLKHYGLVDILLGLGKSRKTGILEVTVGSTVKKIFIEKGIKIFAVSTNTNDRLGESLLTQGKITLEEYQQASYLVEKNGKRLGQVLIDLGYLKPSDLVPAVQHQLEEIIMGLFNIDEGNFVFKEGRLPKEEPIKLRVSTANLIYNGIKRINSFPMVDKMCPPLETVFNLSRDPIPLFQSLPLEYADKKLLSHVNGVNPLKTLLSLSHTRNFETLKAIISLLTIGLITVKGANEDPVKPPLEVIFGIPDEASAVEIDKYEEEEAEIGTGTSEETPEQTSRVDTQWDMAATSKEEEQVSAMPQEAPVEEITEEKHEEEEPAVGAGVSEETPEQTSSVNTQWDMAATSKEEEQVSAMPHEALVEGITEEKHEEEEPAVGAGVSEETPEQTSRVDTQWDMAATSKEEEQVSAMPQEAPVEEITEEKHEEEEPAVGAGVSEETPEQTSSVNTQWDMAATSKEEEQVSAMPQEAPVEGITEEKHEEEEPAVGAGVSEETSEQTSRVDTQWDMAATSKEEESVIAMPHEAPVEEITEEKHEEEKPAVGAGVSEETPEQTSSVDTQREMAEKSNEYGTVREEHDRMPVENITEEIGEEQPVADTVPYVEETSGVPESVAVHTDMSTSTREQGYVPVNDMTSEKITAGVMLDAVQPNADNAAASEKPRSKKIWVISVFIIIILLGALVPLFYENIKTYILPSAATTIQKTETVPSFRDKALGKATTGMPEDNISFPTFREEALKKLLNE